MLITLFTLFIIALGIGGIYFYYTKPVGNNKTVEIEVETGDTFSTVGSKLKEKGMIRSLAFYKMYLKTKKNLALKTGTYEINGNMNLDKIIETMTGKPNGKPITITFKEGKNMKSVIETITSRTMITEAEINAYLQNKEYLNKLINKYWFISNEILDTNIYYSLEGYLYPDTYEFDKNTTIEQIFTKMLDNLENKLQEYKEIIQNGSYSFHQFLTIASMVELEAKDIEDRHKVASVFYNRLAKKMPLGSDVTTYYGAKVDMGERDLYKSELNAENAYNTRNINMAGKIPIGPICNPDISSIKAAITPARTNNYYFVADKNGKVYFTKTNTEHEQMIKKLKEAGLWYTY